MGRFVRPETVTLPLSGGDTIIVRRRLNTAGARAMFARMSVLKNDGTRLIDPLLVGVAHVAAYLVDWTIRDDTGTVVMIRDQPASVVESALDNLDADDFVEIKEAVDRHIDAQAIARAEEKKTPAGAPALSAI